MGLMSRAQKRTKQDMIDQLEEQVAHLQTIHQNSIPINGDLYYGLEELAKSRGMELQAFVQTRLQAIYHAYVFQKTLTLQSYMPFGQYKGILVEDMIRADPRYTNWLASESSIFVLDEEATELLKELS